jgi:hypothetical protein
VKLTTHLHLVPMSGIRGAIPPLPQSAFMAWCSVESTGTNLPLFSPGVPSLCPVQSFFRTILAASCHVMSCHVMSCNSLMK